MIDEIDYESDTFADITAKDGRFEGRAYALLMDVARACSEHDLDLLEEFKETALDQFGPLAYTVLSEWGVSSTEDVGEMMLNLAESKRIPRELAGSAESYAGGYDFKEAFLDPYEP